MTDHPIQLLNITPPRKGFDDPQEGRCYSTEGIAPCVRTTNPPIIVQYDNFIKMTDQNTIELPSELKGKKFRIRKLTPRECFRLMGVSDTDIDKIQAAGISDSAQYKLAGNSIVVDVLFHIFRKLFIETEPDLDDKPTQLTLW